MGTRDAEAREQWSTQAALFRDNILDDALASFPYQLKLRKTVVRGNRFLIRGGLEEMSRGGIR